MKKKLTIGCSKGNLALIRSFVRDQLEDLDIRGKTSDQIVLAADEACANCIIHQHNEDENSTIEVGIYKEAKTLYIEIKDTGTAFPINEYTPKKLKDIVKNRQKGGFGIMLIKKLMDEVKVEQSQDHFIYRLSKKV